VATEFGVAHLRSRTVRERARALARVAHPDFRPELEARAETLG
jgi:4-hydroxybutyrate CoA-transferase